MKIDVLGVGFDDLTVEQAVAAALSLTRTGGTHYVVTPNPEIVEVCRERADVLQAVNGADLVLPDGIGIIKGAKLLGTPLQGRAPGIEFAEGLMSELAKTGQSLYILGGKPGVAVEAAKRLAMRYPGLRFAGFRDGYFKEDAPVVEEIRGSGADVVFVCLGAPKQELWMERNGVGTGAKLLCGLGGSVDIFAGVATRAPAFWCNHGLEWFYRLCKEPWRWKRMTKLPVFLWHVWRSKKDAKPPVKTEAVVDAEPTLVAASVATEAVDDTEPTLVAASVGTEAVDDTEPTLVAASVATEAVVDAEPTLVAASVGTEAVVDAEPTLVAASDARQQDAISSSREQSTEGQMSENTTNWDANKVRQAQTGRISGERTERSHRKRKGGMKWWAPVVYLFVVCVLSVILASFGWELASDLCAFNRGAITQHTVEIAEGDTLNAVIDKLYDAGLIKYKFFFRLFAEFTHAEQKIGAGTYQLNTDMDYRALVVGMRNSSSKLATGTVKVTIPEGYTVRDICSILAEKGVATEEELLNAARNATFDFSFIDNESHDLTRLEGYLYPDTYEFYTPENPERALTRFLNNFARKIDSWEDAATAAENRGYDLKKVVIIASLIEKETDGTDQGKIASVIYNRLDGSGSRAGTYGLLQIDASVLYGIPNHTGPITSADLEYDSPYNLYQHAGLPPTAIANPGAQSLLGAMLPEDTDYYYYALAKDGKHRFFSNYSEFSRFLSSGDYIGN